MTVAAVVESAPAGGAAPVEVLIGFAASSLFVTGLLVLGLGHRSGRVRVLARAGGALERLTSLPAWAALPGAVALGAFSLAGLGFVWDVALHVAQGRDEGPFGTPAHYLMLAGIFGFLAAGWLAVCMPVGVRRPTWVRLRGDWYAPASGLVMMATAGFSFAGFPLDDLWHQVFGQDVTLWGPTHLMMISGGLFNFFALTLLFREAHDSVPEGAPSPPRWLMLRLGGVAATVALTGLTVAYQQEFAYGIPQFRLLFQPTLIAFSAAVVLVAARLGLGRGGALTTALSSIAVMGVLTLLVGPVLGSLTHHFPLYMAEAALVELAAARGLRGYRLAVVAGALIGTVGVAAEWGWSQLWMPIAWPPHLLSEAVLRSLVVAVAGGLLGAFVAGGLRRPAKPLAVRPGVWRIPATALGVAVISFAALLPTSAPAVRAEISLTEVREAPRRTVHATVRLSPPEAAEGADWLQQLAWQGREGRVVAPPLLRIGPGVYRTTEPLPVYGTWKSMLRLHRGGEMGTVPVSFPADAAIPAPAIAALPVVRRPFVADQRLMQRERRDDVPGWLFSAASAAVAAATVAMLWLLGWTLTREARGARRAGAPYGCLIDTTRTLRDPRGVSSSRSSPSRDPASASPTGESIDSLP